MFLLVALATLLPRADAEEAAETQRFSPPIRVYAAHPKAILRSGPGDEYYGTLALSEHQPLDVYLQTGDGWLGIRPPTGSFCWIPARSAYLLPGGRVLEVTTPGTVCWIGSATENPAVLRWQVELNRGEQLAVLGETVRERSDGPEELWYKVAPPSGEFRWIHQSEVSREEPPVAGRSDPSDGVHGPTSGNAQAGQSVADKPRGGKPVQDSFSDGNAGETPNALESPSTNRARKKTSRGIVDANPDVVRSRKDRAVQPAQYEEVVVGEPIMEIEDGEVVIEDSVLDAPLPGEVVYEHREVPTSPPPLVDPHDPTWAGWHAFDFEFPKLRIPFLARLFGQAHGVPTHDPLAADPYSLEVVGPAQRRAPAPAPVVVPHRIVHAPHSHPVGSGDVQESRRRTPWRDPRDLRQRRLEGKWGGPDTIPAPRELLDSIRSNLRELPSATSGSSSDSIGAYPTGASSSEAGIPPIPTTASPLAGASNAAEATWYGIGAGTARMVGASTPSLDASPLTHTDDTRALEALRIALSEEVAKPSGTWNLEPIRAEIVQLIEHGSTPLLRGQARLLLERLDEFKNHAQRAAMLGAPLLSAYATTPAAEIAPPAYDARAAAAPVVSAGYKPEDREGTGSVERAAGLQPFDATGLLIPVFSSSPAQPQYALADDSGQIIAYVTPLAGMKLDHYVNQPVGVRGLRGYLPQLQAKHIQAERVVRLR